jgi:hypothetical protein
MLGTSSQAKQLLGFREAFSSIHADIDCKAQSGQMIARIFNVIFQRLPGEIG